MNTKDLTKAEAGIVVAQIAERLERFYKFHGQLIEINDNICKSLEQIKCDNEMWAREWKRLFNERSVELASAMQVPIDVFTEIFNGEFGHLTNVTRDAVKLAKMWAAGKVSPKDLSYEWEVAVDIFHWNIGWVFVEMPSVEFGSDGDDEESFMRFVRIGSRNFKGSKLIPPLPECCYMADFVNKWNAMCERE
jgi:hypothetical protein